MKTNQELIAEILQEIENIKNKVETFGDQMFDNGQIAGLDRAITKLKE